jgi:predicted RNA-binding Zn-ribbon protein involved in translation (DUF1610 family)
MANPCPRCGTTKTESVRHGFIHDTLWNLGFHLRRCSFCNRRRLFKRADRTRPHPDDMTWEELQERFDRKIAEVSTKPFAASETMGGNMAFNSSEESRGHGAQPSRSSIGVEEWTDGVEDFHSCPKCGSTHYRRSHRRWYERLVRRPKMARCLKCNHRFPYPH